MNRSTCVSLSLLACVVCLCASTTFADQRVSIDSVVNSCGPYKIITGAPVGFDIYITNTPGTTCSYEPALGFRVYSPDGATWNSTTIDTVNGFGDLFDYVAFGAWGITGSGEDSVAVACSIDGMSGKPGLYDGYDDVALEITVIPDSMSDGLTLCVDTFTHPGIPEFAWAWDGLSGCNDIVPEWGGPYCWEIDMLPDMGPYFPTEPDDLQGRLCDTLSAQFHADGPFGVGVTYYLSSGPGEIDPYTGLWIWEDISPEYANTSTSLVIEARECGQIAYASVNVSITNDPPTTPDRNTLVSPCCAKKVILEHEDSCPEDTAYFFVYETDMTGDLWFEGDTLIIVPWSSDDGTHDITIGVSDGMDTSFALFTASVTCCCLCGCYTNGYTGNVDGDLEGKRNLADISRLIDYVYLSKKPMCCPDDGNVDGDEEWRVNLADISRLIDHVYISKQETAPCLH